MLPVDLCRLFDAHHVEFPLIGGQAVIAPGYPRLTKHFDLWVRPTAVNGARILTALSEFGTPLTDLSSDQFTNPSTIIMLGRDPFRMDLLADIPGVDFDSAWARRRLPSSASRRSVR